MVNGVAAIVFIALTHVDWILAGLIAVGATIGGLIGARYGRRLPPMALRVLVVIIGLISAVRLIFFYRRPFGQLRGWTSTMPASVTRQRNDGCRAVAGPCTTEPSSTRNVLPCHGHVTQSPSSPRTARP